METSKPPLAASIMAIEVFGPAVAPFAAIAGIGSFVIVGHRNVYPSQILGVAKTRSVRVPAGVHVGSLEDIRIRPSFRRPHLLVQAFRRAAKGRTTGES